MKSITFVRNSAIIVSFAFYAAGLLYLFMAEVPPPLLIAFSGILLIFCGIVKISGFLSHDRYCLAFQYDLALGAIAILLGVIIFVFQNHVVAYLPMGLGWLAFADGLFKIQMSKDARDFGLEQWNIILGAAFITVLLSVILIFRCLSDTAVPRFLTGAVLLSIGVLNHCTVLYAMERKPSGKHPHKIISLHRSAKL